LLLTFVSLFAVANDPGPIGPASRLATYHAELIKFRQEFGGSHELPDVRFFLFGMGLRNKMIYRDGRLVDAHTGKLIREWAVKSDLIVPPDYLVSVETIDGARVNIREDEVAAESMGVDTTAYKVRAFVVSSFFAGVAGALFSHFQSIITPGDSFSFVKSMEIVVMVVAGGLGSTTGAVVAAVVLTLLPEGMRALFISLGGDNAALAQSIDQLRKPIFGLLLVLMMLTRPQGLFGTHEVWDLLKRKKGATA
jgi:hypothetical protein